MTHWYLVYTRPKDEERVEKNLSEGGVTCYFPKLGRKMFAERNGARVIEPLFPRYIFVKTDICETYWKIKYTRGVVSFVEFGKGPTVVDGKIVERIRQRECNGFIPHPASKRKFRKNDSVSIKRGVLKNIDGIFDEYISNGERVLLLLESVSANIRVNIGTQYL